MKLDPSKHDADGKPKNGVFKENFKDGTLVCVGHDRNGEKVGVWLTYDARGKLIKTNKHKSK